MNKPSNQYNCMAYALGRTNWMLPKGWRTISVNPSPRNETYVVNKLVETFNLLLVEREDMILGEEYIAFRLAYTDFETEDFHFMKRSKTGHWTHKMGSHPIKGISQKVVFADTWGFRDSYNSKVYLFQVRN